MPSTHNAGSYGMSKLGCCQDDNLKVQFDYGVRHYCLRLNTDRKGTIRLAHGLSMGDNFETAIRDLRDGMLENPSEFFILDVREYYPQKFGPVTVRYKADPKKINEIIEKYLEPKKYALTDFDDIGSVTIGDVRKSGKRFMLLNYREDYAYSVNCPHIFPWSLERHGRHAYAFVTEATDAYDENDTSGFFWFQTQLTPNFGTDIGIVTPRALDKHLRWHFQAMIKTIINNPKYLEKANIISGDFMTMDYFKVSEILLLNLNKDAVIPEKREEFKNQLKAYANFD